MLAAQVVFAASHILKSEILLRGQADALKAWHQLLAHEESMSTRG